MASLGELFIELGVVGDTKELDKALNTMKETIKAVDKQIQQSERLRRYREELAKATTKGEKDAIKNEFALTVKKNKLLEQADATKKNIEANKELANNIAGVVKGVAGFVTAVTGAIWAVNKLTNQLVQSNQVFLNLTRTSDISLNTFQKWDSVGKMLGVQNAADQIEGLNERLFELMLTGEGARGFQLAGINPMGQDANGVMEQIRNRISGLSDTSASYLLKQMGLDPQMLHLLRMSREEFEALNAEMAKYRLTPEQRASIQQMNIQLQIASQKLQYLKDRAILAIMPAWIKFIQSFVRVVEGLKIFVQWLGKIEILGGQTTKSVLGLITAIGLLKIALWGLTTHPVIAAITGIVAALYLLIDDIMGYFQGKNSGIGYLINGLEDYFKDLEDKFGDLSLNKVIPQVTIDVTKLIIKASTISIDHSWVGKALKKQQYNTLKNINPELLTPKQRQQLEEYFNQTEEPSNLLGYNPNMFLSTEAQRSITNNDNRTASTNTSNVVNQNIEIRTEQPAQSIQQELAFTQFAFAIG